MTLYNLVLLNDEEPNSLAITVETDFSPGFLCIILLIFNARPFCFVVSCLVYHRMDNVAINFLRNVI